MGFFFFKLMIKQIKGYNKQRSFINNQPTSDTIKNLNSRSNATSIICYDFSTLYTNIPHWKLIRILNQLINFCFKGIDEQFIIADRYGIQWNKRQQTGAISFTKNSLKKAVKYLLWQLLV